MFEIESRLFRIISLFMQLFLFFFLVVVVVVKRLGFDCIPLSMNQLGVTKSESKRSLSETGILLRLIFIFNQFVMKASIVQFIPDDLHNINVPIFLSSCSGCSIIQDANLCKVIRPY